jgi:type IV secretory pathway VirD2 relaxase
MKDIGEAAYILGVKIKRDRPKKMLALSQEHYIRKILENFLSQEHYIRKVLEKFHMQDYKFIDTPIVKV